LKRKYERHEKKIQENVCHDQLTTDKACADRDIYKFDGININESDSDENDSEFEGESDSDEDDNDAYSLDSSSSFHDAMTNYILYLQDSSSWVLPDVTSQLTKQAQQ
jgi:hypothetical protein